ncbi:MAG TPA: YIP1 family protein [Candidatus Deferrimicrobium sp.]|nr:YIP1 family protein [Candidatus Deferrimicrobium sp.]
MEQGASIPESQIASNGIGQSLRGLAEVFYKPSALFARLKETPKILAPYVALAVLTFVFWWLVKDIFVQTLAQMPEFQERMKDMELTPQMEKWMGIGQAIQSSLVMLLIPLATALLAWFWGNFVFAGRAGYRQILSVALYSEIVYAVGNLLTLPMILARKSMFVSMSLGALAPEKSFSSPLYIALSKLDVFLIWEFIVIGIGCSIIYGVSRNKGYLLSVLSMGLLSVLSIVWVVISKFVF